MNSLDYPTVDLFLYDLYSGLGKNEEEVDRDRRRFWSRIYDENYIEQNITQLKKNEQNFSHYIELLDARIKPFDAPLDGYYYPVKLGDTLALQIDCAGRNNDPEWEQLSLPEKLQELKKIVRGHTTKIPPKLGQSWLFWGKLATPEQQPEEIARTCYETLEICDRANWKRDLKGQGQYRGATLYELEQPDTLLDGQNLSHHLIICLFPHEKTEPEISRIIGQLYRDLIPLFHYRSKILWVYEKSRELKESLKKASVQMQAIIDSLSGHLDRKRLDLKLMQKDMGNALTISHYYETNLGDFQKQQVNIEINAKNYQERFAKMRNRDRDCNLEFLEKFGESAQDKVQQIVMDSKALSAGVQPLNSFIQTVEGIIDIERTKNERILNDTIAIAGAGISLASLFTSTIGQEETREMVEQLFGVPNHPYLEIVLTFLPFTMSLVFGVIGVVVTMLILRFSRK
ncbi:MAG: hypothetical protein AAGA60_26905 [Cyanobacteria bacterium P01_E01_bin.42]